MFDEMERLAESAELLALLRRYAELAAPDRQAWQGRVGELEGVAAKALVQLHGELIAYGWVEQNTGAAGGCYRATPAGLRALKQARAAAA